nr:DUF2207 domain-containing protein [Actinomycetota bacterium]
MRGSRLRLLPAVAVLALVAVLAPGCSLLDRKSYTFPRVAIDATVNQDGSLSIVERRTFDFRGEFHFAFFTVEHKQFNDVVEFSVREGEHVYKPGRPGTTGGTVLEDNVLEGPGGFKFKATWWFDARDERRTFIISYRVRCAVDPYLDTAHLLWKFIGEGWTVVTDSAVIAVHLPGKALDVPPRPTSRCIPSVPNGTPGYPLDRPPRIATSAPSRSEVRAWGHGPLQGAVRFARPQKVVLYVSDVPPATFVEGSILFPLASVPYLNQPEEPGRQ